MTKTKRFALARTFGSLQRVGCEWESFEDFCQWAESQGYRTGLTIYALNQNKPHGPDNSYLYYKGLDLPDIKSPFCEGCTRKYCPGNKVGCAEYRSKWKKNWNENICRKPKEPAKPTGREVFRYEHPDLVREGIVVEHS